MSRKLRKPSKKASVSHKEKMRRLSQSQTQWAKDNPILADALYLPGLEPEGSCLFPSTF